jgi:hypothetical protein
VCCKHADCCSVAVQLFVAHERVLMMCLLLLLYTCCFNRMLTAIAALPQLEVLLLSQGNYAGFSTFMYGNGKATDEGLLKLVARGADCKLRSLTLKNLGSANGQELLRAAAGTCPLLTDVSITGTNETRTS